jgi:hypothetical protein
MYLLLNEELLSCKSRGGCRIFFIGDHHTTFGEGMLAVMKIYFEISRETGEYYEGLPCCGRILA